MLTLRYTILAGRPAQSGSGDSQIGFHSGENSVDHHSFLHFESLLQMIFSDHLRTETRPTASEHQVFMRPCAKVPSLPVANTETVLPPDGAAARVKEMTETDNSEYMIFSVACAERSFEHQTESENLGPWQN